MPFDTVKAADSQANYAFVVSQTASIEARINKVQYEDLIGKTLVPVDTSAADFAKSVTYFSMDRAGQAGWINGNGRDIPMVDTTMSEHNEFVHTAAVGYAFGWEEVGQARMLGFALPSDKAEVARRAADEMIDGLIFVGDAAKNFEGLINNSNVTIASVPADGAGSSTEFQSKSETQILRDFNSAISGIITDTRKVEMGGTVLIPLSDFNYLASTPRSENSDTTLLNYIMANNAFTAHTGRRLEIKGLIDLEEAGVGGTGRMIVYRKAPDVLKFHLPMPHRFLPPQQIGLVTQIPGVFRAGGTEIRKPGAFRYVDGI